MSLQTVLFILWVGTAVVYMAYRIAFRRVREQVYRGPNLVQKMEAIFEDFEGVIVSEIERQALENEASTVFEEALLGAGLLPSGWTLRVENDELLGPSPRVVSKEGDPLLVGEFQRMLNDGEVQLSAA